MEGLGSLLAGLLGTAGGTASSIANTCATGFTQAGSRRSVQVSALLCMVLGLSPRLAGLLTHIPLAVHGGYPALPLAAVPAACLAPPDSCPLQEGCFV